MSSNNPATASAERTGAVFFVHARYRQLAQMPIKNGMSLGRLTTDQGAFFFDCEQFDEASLKRGLRPDETLVIGAHRLRDGSAWLHWLGRTRGHDWPPRAESPYWQSAAALAVSPLLVWAALWFGFSMNLALAVLQVVLFASAAALCAWALYRLALRAHPGRRRLYRGYQAFAAGEAPTLAEPDDIDTPPRLHLANGLHGGFGVLQNTLEHVDVTLTTYGAGRFRYSLHEYGLVCGGEQFALRTRAWDWRELADPILLRRPPLFLAAGDPVCLLSLRGDGDIRGLLNTSDGAAHVCYKSAGYGPLARRVVLGFIVFMALFMLLTGLGVSIHDWQARGVGPDYWDWVELASLSSAMLLSMLILFAVGGVICELVRRFRIRPGDTRAIEVIAGIAYQWRRHSGRRVVVNEFY